MQWRLPLALVGERLTAPIYIEFGRWGDAFHVIRRGRSHYESADGDGTADGYGRQI